MTFSAAVQTAFPNGFIAKHLYVSAWSESTFGICRTETKSIANVVKEKQNSREL